MLRFLDRRTSSATPARAASPLPGDAEKGFPRQAPAPLQCHQYSRHVVVHLVFWHYHANTVGTGSPQRVGSETCPDTSPVLLA